ncbi:DUF349 domain-containing protein [Povalibacter sp.]|uniref:DUF349 domain-containing protein n=1 Tax=Povalibacter sp. TaxID=1962978 RepID=UPI002F42A1EE
MSLFSRLRKALSSSAPAQQPETVVTSVPVPAAPDSALLAEQEEKVLRAAIAAGDFRAVAPSVIDGSSTRTRQLAAEAIDDPEQIRELIRKVRGGNDKNVYRILTRKRDAALAIERQLEQQQAEISTLTADIERHSRRPFDPLFTPTLEQLENRWNAVAAHAAPDVAQAAQVAIDRAREVIAQHLRHVAAQAARELAAANEAAAARSRREEEERAAAAAAAERTSLQEEARRAEAENRETEARALSQIGGLLRKALGALAAGNSKVAAGMRRTVEEKLTTAPPLPAHLANQLKQLDAKLEELKDWKSFSVVPKRAELIEQMESLIGATLHPPVLAGQIKDLQEQWRTLSKGAGEDVETEWQRFHEAAQKAFQPCREYFESQDQVRKENLEQRGLLFERLRAFEANHNWEEPEWRTVITAVREAKQLWRQHSPVDAAESAPLQGKFDELTATLQSRIDAEYARNVKARKALIDRAGGLLASADGRNAAEEVKELQEQWQSTGIVPRHEDRKLWEEFRQHCDAVFQKRQQEFASRAAALDTNRTQAADICEELERIAGLTDQELLENVKKLPELRLAFDSIEELPRANARQLQDRFERAFERCKRAVSGQQARDIEHAWMGLLDAANPVRAYRLARARQSAASELDALRQSADDHIASIAQSPKGGIDALKRALADSGGDDLAANERALRTLCIRAELLTDAPTPAEDQPLRREYQLQRLMQSMGQGDTRGGEQLDALAFEWLGAGPVDEATYVRLLDRFKECRKRALKFSSR